MNVVSVDVASSDDESRADSIQAIKKHIKPLNKGTRLTGKVGQFSFTGKTIFYL
jgi:hypothetical protein